MRLALRVAPRAEREIRKAASWWLANRPSAPELFHQELARAFELITTEPHVGLRSRDAIRPNVRRLHLYRIRYYLYYRTHEETTHVLAFWHSSRAGTLQL